MAWLLLLLLLSSCRCCCSVIWCCLIFMQGGWLVPDSGLVLPQPQEAEGTRKVIPAQHAA
jgi:hypothetical protein